MQEQACLCHGPCVGIHALTFLFIRGRVSLLSAPAHTSQLASDSLIGSQTLQMHATTSGIYVDSGSWTQALKLHGRCSAHQVDPQPGTFCFSLPFPRYDLGESITASSSTLFYHEVMASHGTSCFLSQEHKDRWEGRERKGERICDPSPQE